MINIEKELKKLIKKEKLDKPEVYYANYETYEEPPLFSRFSYISFLQDLSFDEKNKILIKTAIELANKALKQVNQYLTHGIEEYFICVVLTNWDDIDEFNCIKPRIFISRRKSWILSHLKLIQKNTVQELLITCYINELGFNDFKVYRTTLDDKENETIYIVSDFFHLSL